MKIKTKFLFIFIFITLLYGALTFFRYHFLILPSFNNLDRELVIKTMKRCGSILDYISDNNLRLVKDYASLEGISEYLFTGDERWANDIFSQQVLLNNNAEFIVLINEDNRILRAEFNKQSELYSRFTENDEFFNTILKKYSHLICSKEGVNISSVAGYMNFEGKILNFAAAPVLAYTKEGAKSSGTLIIGKYFGKRTVDRIMELAGVNVSIYGLKIPEMEHNKDIIIHLSSKLDVYSITPVSETEIEVVSILKDIDNKPLFEIRVRLLRELYKTGIEIADSSMKITILVGLFFVLLIGVFIDIIFLRPLSNFTNTIIRIRENNDYSTKIKMNLRNDEINILKREFSLMLLEIKDNTDDMENLIKEKNEKLINSRKEMIYRLAYAAETKDRETGHHLKRLYQYTKYLAAKCDTPGDYAEEIALASILHDIGKIGIPEKILLKKERLSDEEFEEMKQHTVYGGKILDNCDYGLVKTAHDIALYHHERFDGKGYPYGLKKKEIPFPARLVAIVDVFDALISKRPYKDGWSIDEIKKYFETEKGKIFDPNLTEIFLKEINSFLKIYTEYCD